ncbi:nicotinate-nucleotide adenylyltransferase [Paenibacillus harenae]|uniref:Probable nicotinate-nucleotide adenylyltransferase n=1 Tax=Paenibacillus harenae TaxID=306543 RepID=A0ABT9TZG5_PAEHA|nr:nicotinate-nucleotide adenylyltransferase [Paenibacillus harenae]MDQ0059248.1 nicotinate-nucleotide adenylyltransferase [Paenibacillus harenae]MDQ0112713.1 nicotinate-nucleotide adenylyltransferase [Paenibacillus harenae]
MSKIGIMGGTFDPVHTGHLLAAEKAREQCGLQEVWFIPSYMPPLKANEPGVSSEHRYGMVEAAVATNDAFRVLDIELKRGGISYSYDTVSELIKRYPGRSFAYIIGSDRINDLCKWHRIEELAELVTFIGLERPAEPAQPGQLPSFLKQRLTIVEMPPIGISSTDIRNRLTAGHSVQYMVPDTVLEYIRRYGLYESRADD